jgi:hypothetical protein
LGLRDFDRGLPASGRTATLGDNCDVCQLVCLVQCSLRIADALGSWITVFVFQTSIERGAGTCPADGWQYCHGQRPTDTGSESMTFTILQGLVRLVPLALANVLKQFSLFWHKRHGLYAYVYGLPKVAPRSRMLKRVYHGIWAVARLSFDASHFNESACR